MTYTQGQAVIFRLASEQRNFEHRGTFDGMATGLSAFVRDDDGPRFVVSLDDIRPASGALLAAALAVVDQAQACTGPDAFGSGLNFELFALRGLAEAVRVHLLAHPENRAG